MVTGSVPFPSTTMTNRRGVAASPRASRDHNGAKSNPPAAAAEP
ncbi:MAG: hypothetical protein AAGN82_00100 [Myxococcota bacterium]